MSDRTEQVREKIARMTGKERDLFARYLLACLEAGSVRSDESPEARILRRAARTYDEIRHAMDPSQFEP